MRIVLVLLLSLASALSYAKSVTVTDIRGRDVTVTVPVQKIFLANSRDLLSLDIAAGSDSFKHIVGWSDSLTQYAPDMEQAYFSRFPELKNIPLFKNKGNPGLDIEALIKLHPDVIIDNAEYYGAMQEAGTINKLTQAGIAVVFVDYKNDLLKHTPETIILLGELFDQSARATKFVNYYQQHINALREKLSIVSHKPTVLIERHAGLTDSCCTLFGTTSYGELATQAGAVNLESSTKNGGEASVENILHLNPDFYVMTGANWTRFSHGSVAVPLGYNADKVAVEKQLATLDSRTGLATLPAIKDGHVMAIYHHFYNNPLNFIAIEAMAKLFHPDLFADLDPAADLQQVHQQFTSIAGSGIFWITP